MDGAQLDGVERRSLWQDFLLDAGTSPDQHPAPLFGKKVVDRIFESAGTWHWRKFAWSALSVTALWLGLVSWNAWQAGGTLLALSSSAFAMLAATGAFHLWSIHHRLTLSDLHLLAETPEQSRWLDRLENYLKRIVDGTVPVFDGGSGARLAGSYFAGNNGRIVVLDSCDNRTDRARKQGAPWTWPRAIGAPFVQIEPSTEGAEPEPAIAPGNAAESPTEGRGTAPAFAGTPEAPNRTETPDQAPGSPRKIRHYLHGVTRPDFEAALTEYLAAMPWAKDRKDEFRFVIGVVYKVVQDDPYPKQKELLRKVRDRVAASSKITLNKADETVFKIIGNARKKDGSDFRTFVIARRIQPPLDPKPKSRG